ncbi:MAG: hypothetical protein IKJ93_03165 [Clostridia bacterium]|nr:hypothetical protein [Clostridia bacterium]
MREENNKEKLTKERIKTDIKNKCIDDIKAVLRTSLILLLFLVLPPIILYKVFTPFNIPTAISTMITIYSIVIVFLTVCCLYKPFKLLFGLYKKGFQIATDKLSHSTEMTLSDILIFSNWWLIYSLSKPYRLSFNSYNKYLIPKGKNYRWSDMYCMDDKGVYNYSTIGDEFYLAVIDNKIAFAYNKKLFELMD